ncbi:MAG: hypothetical protein JWL77_6219 [Chthonomonadaceae bacterium]|nr:hypothetical protein [Chthonomonadaceae bacterium]
MSEPTKPGKRIVSKGRFVANTGKKAALATYGTAVCLLGLGAIVVSSVSVLPMLLHEGLLCLVGIATLGGCCFGLIYLGGKAVKEGKEIDAGVPLTRANTAHLPASDSLVRASSEPVQEQATVLLRAAVEGNETPSEQLLWATQESRKDA